MNIIIVIFSKVETLLNFLLILITNARILKDSFVIFFTWLLNVNIISNVRPRFFNYVGPTYEFNN